MATLRIKKKQLKKLQKLQLEKELKELQDLDQELIQVEEEIKKAKKILKKKKATLKELQSSLAAVQEKTTLINQAINQTWKEQINVDKEIGKKKYTEGQRSYAKALKLIEERIGKAAPDIKAIYGSDDIEELANQLYIKDLEGYSQEDLKGIEEEFNSTHGYKIRIEKATNPFEGIDFLNM